MTATKVIVLYRSVERNKHNSIPIIESHAYNLLMNCKIFEEVRAVHWSKLSSIDINPSDYHCISISLGQYFFKWAHNKLALLKRFKSFHVWFDDICVWKLTEGGYKQYKDIVMNHISSVFCPREVIALQLNEMREGIAHYVPWSIPYHHFKSNKKSKQISILVDWDLRKSACKIKNYMPLMKGVRACKNKGINIKLYTRSPEIINRLAPIKVNSIGRLPYPQFLALQNETWIYASGINGSYEFSVMESQILGNYIFSLKNNVNSDLYLDGETGFVINNKKDFVKYVEHIIKVHNPQLVHDTVANNLFNRKAILEKINSILLTY